MVVREALHRGLGGGADAAAGHVHDAAQGHRICGVGDRDEVRHRILDLGPLVELGAAEHLVGQGRADEDVLDRSRLRVRAVEHRDVAVGDAGVAQLRDLVGDELRLVVAGVAGVSQDLLARADRGEQLLVLAVEVVADHRVRGIQDVLRRPVVLLEQDHLRVREVALELDDVADVGAAERVDRLVAVADDRQTRAGDAAVSTPQRTAERVVGLEILRKLGRHRTRELADERVLRVVRVLVLVDEDVAEPPLVQRRDLRERAEQVDRLPDQVVEVERVRLLETRGCTGGRSRRTRPPSDR